MVEGYFRSSGTWGSSDKSYWWAAACAARLCPASRAARCRTSCRPRAAAQ
jgi:hypothetical protein